MPDPLIDIRPDHRTIVADILRRHVPDREVWAFGSRATWNAKEYSDFDLAVIGETPLSLSVSAALADDFAESDLPFKVDVVDWPTTSESFRKIIERDKVVVQKGKGRSVGMAGVSHRSALGDYFTLQRGTTYKSRLLGQPGPALLGLATIQRNGGFRRDSLQTYGGDSPDKLLVQPGELYLSLKDVTQSADLLGAVAKLPLDHPPGRLTQDTVKLEPKGTDVPLDYLYWLLRTPQYRRYCRAHATGTTNLGLAREDFLAFPAPEPTPMQCRIVDTLDKLDDKLELNRRMNETLEAMARALFKSWFVDFDPVRAKMEGCDPGRLPKPLADLFPARLVDFELGEIPERWEVAAVGDQVRCIKGKSYKSEHLQDSDTALVTLKSFARGGGYRPDGLKGYTGDFKPEQVVRAGELVVACTDVTQAAEVIGKPALVRSCDEFATLVASLDVLVVRPRSDSVSVPFLYCLFRTDQFSDHTYAHSTGTTVLHLDKNAVPSYRFALPTENVAKAFACIAELLFKRLDENERESRTLAVLRDTLLPKLISGELRVKDAERFVGRQA